MKFSQLMEYNNINVFLHNHAENEARPLCFFKKIYMYEVKANDLQLSFNIF